MKTLLIKNVLLKDRKTDILVADGRFKSLCAPEACTNRTSR